MISDDNWYCIGESGYNVDPLYSTGMTFISIQTVYANTLMYGKLSKANPKHMSQLAHAFNTMEVALGPNTSIRSLVIPIIWVMPV